MASCDGIDGRVDLYSLGCVGYWLLTGEPVFEGETVAVLISHHLRSRPVPPSRRTELSIPGDLEDVIMSCLRKEPARRPESAAALGEQLAACSHTRDWTSERGRIWWEKHLPEMSPGTPA